MNLCCLADLVQNPIFDLKTSLKTHFLFSLLFSVAILLTGCQKKPVASFTTDKETYLRNEKLLLSNTSSDAYSWTWIIRGPEQEEFRSTEPDLDYILSKIGSYEISLSCYSKSDKFVSKTSKTVVVSNNTGSVVFYKSRAGVSYALIVNGYTVGYFGGNFLGVADCGDTGALTYESAIGQLNVEVLNTYTYIKKPYSITVEGGKCKPVFINF
jgi:hypothetical protein